MSLSFCYLIFGSFLKDEKFYINYKEIALKIVGSKISFFNNYTATLNPIFPDVAEVVQQVRAQLASSLSNNTSNAFKLIDGNKNSSLMMYYNTPICKLIFRKFGCVVWMVIFVFCKFVNLGKWDDDIDEKTEIND